MRLNKRNNMDRLYMMMCGGKVKKYEDGGMMDDDDMMEGSSDLDQAEPIRTIEGQNTSEVQVDEEGNQFVIYETPEGDSIEVYGDWETYGNIMAPGGGGVRPGEPRYIEDRTYPVIKNRDTGKYELDSQAMESEHMREPEQKMAREAIGGQGGSRMQDLLEKLSQRGMMR